MRILVIETATAACSVALFSEGAVLETEMAVVGRGHAERLMPMIAALPDGGRADAIWVDCGPGSFTGIRVGIAAARGLGFGWGVPVHGFSSMALRAADWFAGHDGDHVTVIAEGGHGEKFVEGFARAPLRTVRPLMSIPAAMVDAPGPAVIDLVPDVRVVMLLGDATLPPTPIYGRGPDAKPMAA